MSYLMDEIEARYTDANGLVCNRPCAKTEVNPSGNGVCYTGEYVAILRNRDELRWTKRMFVLRALLKCWTDKGPLFRGPGQPDIESVDDYYGLAATHFF
jgi:hypothetical protein